MNDSNVQFQGFRSLASTVLGGLIGALIGLPLTAGAQSPVQALLIVGALLALGSWTGYRKRQNRGFFYFSLVCALILATLLSVVYAPPM